LLKVALNIKNQIKSMVVKAFPLWKRFFKAMYGKIQPGYINLRVYLQYKVSCKTPMLLFCYVINNGNRFHNGNAFTTIDLIWFLMFNATFSNISANQKSNQIYGSKSIPIMKTIPVIYYVTK
jgi:hypothetical protein